MRILKVKRLISFLPVLLLLTLCNLARATPPYGCDWATGVVPSNPCSEVSTPNTSSTSYMLSHRFQRHSAWLNNTDGTIFVIANMGTTDNALQLFMSNDRGATWTSLYSFAGTTTGNSASNGLVSTDDIAVQDIGSGSYQIYVVYDVDAAAGSYTPAVKYSKFTYVSSTRTLTLGSGYPLTVTSNSSKTYQSPAQGWDANGNTWITFNESTSSSNDVRMYFLPGGGSSTFYDSGVSFTNASTDSTHYNHAAHPIPTASATNYGAIGVLLQTSTCVYFVGVDVSGSGGSYTFSVHTAGGAPEQITCGLPAAQSNTEDSGYSVIADDSGNLYMGVVQNVGSGNTEIETFKQTAAADWTADGYLDAATNYLSAVYVKSFFLTNSNNNYVGMMVNELGSLALYTHKIGGTQEWVFQGYYTHPTAGSGQSYGNPRIEVPPSLANSGLRHLPIWEEYTYDSNNNRSLIYWYNIAINY